MTTYSCAETCFAALADLIGELIESDAFLQRRGDDNPFVLAMPILFDGSPDLHFFAMVDEKDDPVAFVSTLPDDAPDALAIGPLYVTPAARGQGLGRDLVRSCVEHAWAGGKAHLVVETWGTNTAARRTFESVGFRLDATEPDARVNGDSTVCYRLDREEL